MNTKKNKHKKPNKPPNPNPPQKAAHERKVEENVQVVPEQCEVKSEANIPEIKNKPAPENKSEAKPEIKGELTPVTEVRDLEFELPKKPKRNKGKNKKKQDEDDNVSQNVDKKSHEHNAQKEQDDNKQGFVQELKAEKVEEIEQKYSIDAASYPSARKNKNKHQEKPVEESTIASDTIKGTSEEQQIQQIDETDVEITELLASKPETAKQDAKKKKNKKKKRNDSEKSDKEDLSCTSAFQKLLLEEKEQGQIKSEGDIRKPVPFVDLLVVSEQRSEASEGTNILKNDPKVEVQEIKQTQNNDERGKKRNKKDKQQLDRGEEKAPETPEELTMSQEALILLKPHIIDVAMPSILSEELKKCVDITKKVEIPKTEQETSPKFKSQIAEPVEKKRKDKHGNQSSDDHKVESENTASAEKYYIDQQIVVKPESQIQNEPIPQDTINKSTGLEIEKPNDPRQAENVIVPESITKKQRKKSPKLPKRKESSIDKEIVDLPMSDVNIEDAGVNKPILTNISHEEKLSVTPMEAKQEQAETTLAEFSTEQDTELGEFQEVKSGKKNKKKTPKIPIQIETTLTQEIKGLPTDFIKIDDKQVHTIQPGTETKLVQDTSKKKITGTEDKPKQHTDEKVEIPFEMQSTPEIEVSSVVDSNDGSILDVSPDIIFIRSSSQHNIDNNNNMIIQEVMNIEGMKLTEPFSVPLIEGSGETPSETPEMVSSGIQMTEIATKPSVDEKTDVKSKMIEVNQDMEELRLSIERSLAEFTAMEGREKEAEKEFEDQMEFKKHEPSPIGKERVGVQLEEKLVPRQLKEKSPLPASITAVAPLESKHPKQVVPEVVKENLASEVDSKEPENIRLTKAKEDKCSDAPPICPARKDNKGKGKIKKKGKQETTLTTSTSQSGETNTQSKENESAKEEKQDKTKSEQKADSTQEKGKQQSFHDSEIIEMSSDSLEDKSHDNFESIFSDTIDKKDFEPIDNFEDAMTSSIIDVNKTFEIIAEDAVHDNEEMQKKLAVNKPDINVTEATEDNEKKRDEKVNPISQPKNLLGHNDIPVQSNKTDYKKEKNKTPNARQAKVKIKDSVDIETEKQSKECQTDNKRARKNSDKSVKESFSRVTNDNEEYVYKYSFRKVFLQNACHVCYKDLSQVRVPCGYCSFVFYCGARHKDEDWPQHQALCFAVSTIAHMKHQKHIYADAKNITGQDYRLLRMQTIVSCEKVLKRRLVPWEQEAMLYPRICADVGCREWRQSKLQDCDGCGQLSYCAINPDHLPNSHQRWCKSYCLYQKLVSYQQINGRLEPKLPTKVMKGSYEIPGKMNEVLAEMYEEKIDMSDIQYAAITQLATAPLTAALSLQLHRSKASSNAKAFTNGTVKTKSLTIHLVGAELQFEADALNKWEVFFLHLRPDVGELKVVLVSPMLNPGNLPLDLLGKIKLCDDCRRNNRRVTLSFEDNVNYYEYRAREHFVNPDLICAFNPSIQRSSIYNRDDPWIENINTILKLQQPFIITAYTLTELRKDVARVQQCGKIDFKIIMEPVFNGFASVRPDRNFISDDEMPLLFKNYCVAVLCGS